MNLPTVIVLLVVFALVVMALNALHSGKGSCSCGVPHATDKTVAVLVVVVTV